MTRNTDNLTRPSRADIPRAETARELLRHTVATVAYRGGKAVRGAPAKFATFRVSKTSRTPVEILAHIGDLFDWALSMAKGAQTWRNSTPLPWNQEVARFFAALEAFDAYLASDEPLGCRSNACSRDRSPTP